MHAVLVFHGTGDYTVYPLNGDQVVEQYLDTDNLAAPNSGLNTAFGGGSTTSDHAGQDITGSSSKTTGSVSGGYTYTVYGWNDNSGLRIQYYKIDTMVGSNLLDSYKIAAINNYSTYRVTLGLEVIK
jgi:hypothetical protein